MDKSIIEIEGLIVIFRGVNEEKLPKLLESLYEGGVRIIEIAFNPSDADTVAKTSALIRRACELTDGKMHVGAGTVISEEFLVAAYNAGANFILSPNTDTDIIHLTKKLGMISIPGAMTPSECVTAYKNGADIIKLFPSTENDIPYIVNITRPLSHIPFICVGGTNENTIEKFLTAGAVGVGTGISIVKPELLATDNYDEIKRLASLHVDIIKSFKEKTARV